MLIGISGKIESGKDTVGKIIQYLNSPEYKDGWNNYQNWVEALYEPTFKSEWQIKKFAYKLKQVVSLLTGFPVEDLEKQEVKERFLGKEWQKTVGTLGIRGVKITDVIKIYTVRQLLQELGTDAIRNVIHPNAWVNALFADYKCLSDKALYIMDASDSDIKLEKLGEWQQEDKVLGQYPNWVITDVRFPNEAEAIKARGGITIRVNRNFFNYKFEGQNIAVQRGILTGHEDEQFGKEHPSETALDNATFDYVINNDGSIEELVEKVKEILIKEKIINEN